MTDAPRQPIALITGATDGVGKVTAIELAKRGYHVVLAARSREKAEAVTREIRATAGVDAEYVLGDLASLRQVRAMASAFCARHERLDLLVNNAGVFLSARTETEDCFETTYQVNYLSHFLLTHLLRDALERSADGRIVNLTSSAHSMGKFDLGNLQSEKTFSVLGTYASSKLFMLMFTEELAKRLAGTRVTAYAVHPGVVRTQMMRNAPGVFRFVMLLSLPFSIAPEKGALTTLHVATSPSVRGESGRYFTNGKPARTSNAFDTDENRALLWDASMKALGYA